MWKTKAAAPHRAAAFLVVLDDFECPPLALGIFSGRIILNFGFQKSLRTFLKPIFTKGVVKGNGRCRDTPSVLPLRVKPPSPRGRLNSLSQNLTVLPAPSGREPLAHPEALCFSRKVCRYAKGPILEGAVIERKRNDWGSSHCVSRRKGFYNSPCISTISAQKRLGQWVMRPFSLWRALISSVL